MVHFLTSTGSGSACEDNICENFDPPLTYSDTWGVWRFLLFSRVCFLKVCVSQQQTGSAFNRNLIAVLRIQTTCALAQYSMRTLTCLLFCRTKEIDWTPFLTQKLVDELATHVKLYRRADQKYQKEQENRDLTEPPDGECITYLCSAQEGKGILDFQITVCSSQNILIPHMYSWGVKIHGSKFSSFCTCKK